MDTYTNPSFALLLKHLMPPKTSVEITLSYLLVLSYETFIARLSQYWPLIVTLWLYRVLFMHSRIPVYCTEIQECLLSMNWFNAYCCRNIFCRWCCSYTRSWQSNGSMPEESKTLWKPRPVLQLAQERARLPVCLWFWMVREKVWPRYAISVVTICQIMAP